MNWGLIRSAAIKAAPIAISLLVGTGAGYTGAKATQKTEVASIPEIKVTCEPKVKIIKPDPIKVEFIKK